MPVRALKDSLFCCCRIWNRNGLSSQKHIEIYDTVSDCFPNCLSTDVDECQVHNGGCQHRCVNTRGSYYCECNPGFRLHIDGRTCIGERGTGFTRSQYHSWQTGEWPWLELLDSVTTIHNPKTDYFQSQCRTSPSVLCMTRNESTICFHASWMFPTVLYCTALVIV